MGVCVACGTAHSTPEKEVVYSALEAAAQELEREGERCGPEVCGCPDVGAGERGATRETKSGTAKRMRTGARRMEDGKGANGGWQVGDGRADPTVQDEAMH